MPLKVSSELREVAADAAGLRALIDRGGTHARVGARHAFSLLEKHRRACARERRLLVKLIEAAAEAAHGTPAARQLAGAPGS